MSSFFKITVSAAVLVLTLSCQKESIPNLQTSTSADVNNQDAGDCVKPWIGAYANDVNGNDTIKQKFFIHDGIAQLPAIGWDNYHTGISYHIPSCHTVDGDNVIFEARVKNPSGQIGSVYGYNVALQIQGANNFF